MTLHGFLLACHVVFWPHCYCGQTAIVIMVTPLLLLWSHCYCGHTVILIVSTLLFHTSRYGSHICIPATALLVTHCHTVIVVTLLLLLRPYYYSCDTLHLYIPVSPCITFAIRQYLLLCSCHVFYPNRPPDADAHPYSSSLYVI